MNKPLRKFFSIILAFVMLLSIMPVYAVNEDLLIMEYIYICPQSFKAEYVDGEHLDLNGIKVMFVRFYENGNQTEEDITEFVTANPPHGTPMILFAPENGEAISILNIEYERNGFLFDFSTWISIFPRPADESITVNGIAIPVELIGSVAVLRPISADMTEILKSKENKIIFNLSAYNSVDIYVDAGLFRNIDKTLIFITDNGCRSHSVKTKTLWNNSGKQRLISIRDNKINIRNI